MHTGRLVFSQLLDFLPQHDFNLCVRRYRGNRKVSRFSCRDQFLCLAFAQLTYRESLRDIETCLRAMAAKLYHVGFRGAISRSTLADANEGRDWRIYADFAAGLIAHARMLYAGETFGVDLDQTVYAFDSTTIDLCLTLFPWAQFRRYKSAVKLHTLLDLRGNIPCFVHVSSGAVHDVKELFFKWLKQNLRIKAFYGTSDNAVKTQIWIAVSMYVLVAIVKKELKIERSLGEILQILSLSLFEKMPLLQAFSQDSRMTEIDAVHNALPLFNL